MNYRRASRGICLVLITALTLTLVGTAAHGQTGRRGGGGAVKGARPSVKQHVKKHAKKTVKAKIKGHVKGTVNPHRAQYLKRRAAVRLSSNHRARLRHLRRRSNRHLHWSHPKWCGYYPRRCHWWYSYVGPTYYFDPTCSITYNWYYYHCPVDAQPLVSHPEIRWNLGIKCVLIPVTPA